MRRGVRDLLWSVRKTFNNAGMPKMLASLRKLRRSLLAGQWMTLRSFESASNAIWSNYCFECYMIAC